jgi:DNA mismatch repair protein MutL
MRSTPVKVAQEHSPVVIGKAALSQPAIAFKLLNNNKLVLSTPGNGNLLETAAGLYGPQAAAELLAVHNEQDGIVVSGFVGKPTLLKSSRQWQTFVVNNRVVNSRMLSKALDNAYHSLLPKSGYPLAILNIAVPTQTIDVNVHPQKSEIKFSDEQSVFRAVYRAIVNALTAEHNPLDIATPIRSSHTAQVTPNWTTHSTNSVRSEVSYIQPAPSLWKEDSLPIQTAQAARLKQHNLVGIDESANQFIQTDFAEPSPENQFVLQPLGQVNECYIIAQGEEDLFIIDQHAAHERILYDRFSQTVGRIPAQQLLVPLLLTMDEADISIVMDNSSTLRELGFTIEQIGPSLIRISELPADLPQSDIEATLREIVIALRNNQQPTGHELRHAILQIAACRAAIKAGDSLNMRQIQALLGELCTTTLPYTCPHGRPAIIRFSSDELAKMFKRT